MDTFPRREAERLLKEWDIADLPVNPLTIAHDQGILCHPMPSKEKGVSGMLFKVKDNFGILYSTYHNNEGFERFSIGHELGHYFLGDHPAALFAYGSEHFSKAGFRSDDRYEKEADEFASGLLMPNYLFDPALDQVGAGLGAIKSLSSLCKCSLTATAIRYAQRTPEPSAIIVSVGDRIDYCFMSEELREYPNLNWLKKGILLPSHTKTLEFNRDIRNITSANEDQDDTDLATWFQADFEVEAYEEVIGLGSYGKTLTVLTIPDPPDLDELDADEELEESWTPRFKR